MEQPRFGGVHLPPLSCEDGEGKYAEPCEYHFDRKKDDQSDCPQVKHDGFENDKEKSLQAPEDSSVQKIMDVLQELEISVDLEQHWLKQERQSNAGFSQGVYCKNLLLKDKKGQAYLIICSEDDSADLQVVRYHLNSSGNLYFASRESLHSLLNVQPGAVTPLALIHPSARGVRVFIDASLVKRIDRNSTKLFFHPLVPELQVGLTLVQLEKFLSHCGAALETIPSLVSYSLGRKYNLSTAGSRFKHMAHQDSQGLPHSENPKTEEAVELKKMAIEECTDVQTQPQNLQECLAQYASLFRKLGIKVDIISSNGQGTALVPCRCVYLKDKRNSYFLFICHENQKVDFSNLKTRLKPRKKITPLEKEELSSLLGLDEDREIPFPLANVTQPRFLVAMADNLYEREKAVLTFPHPTDPGLSLKITLKDLEIFLRAIDHDLTTIPVKGTLESLQASSQSAACASPATSSMNTEKHSGMVANNTENMTPTSELIPPSSLIQDNSPAPVPLKGNLFYQMTSSLRNWVVRWLRWIIRLLDRHLPCCISTRLHRSVLWQRFALTGPEESEWQPSDEEQQDKKRREREAKMTKLRQLVEESGIMVEMEELTESDGTSDLDTEQCSISMLLSAKGRPYLMLCSEDDNPAQHSLGRLRTAFRSRGALKPADEANISLLLSWQEGETTMSWTPEELTPLALFQLDLNELGRVRVGVQADIYSFPDTAVTFHLPSIGIRLQMNYDDLERRLKRQGFCLVYLPW